MCVWKEPLSFVWDKGNSHKSWSKHTVSNEECEEVFFDENKKILKDKRHSGDEKRFILLGNTKRERLLFLVFTLHKGKIRIISARDLNRKERPLYEKAT
jgi:uncharacterized protein